MGRPWMIEQNDVIQDSESWHLDKFAVPGGDLLLVAFVRLRMMSSEMHDLVFIGRPGSSHNRPETLLKLLNSEISRWESKWYSLFDQGKQKLQAARLTADTGIRWCLAMSTLPREVLRTSCSLIAQLLLVARLTYTM